MAKGSRRVGEFNHPEIKWVQFPEDIIEMVRLLLWYHGRDDKDGQVPIYSSALKRARHLLGLNMRSRFNGSGPDEGRRIRQYLGARWRERLEVAGIDPDTLEIVSVDRWAIAWEELRKTGQYWPERVETAFRSGWLVPKEDQLRPNHIAITPSPRKLEAERRQAKAAEKERGRYLSTRLREDLEL